MFTIKIIFISESVPSHEFKDSVKNSFTLSLLQTFCLLKYLQNKFISSVLLLAVLGKSFQFFIPCDIACSAFDIKNSNLRNTLLFLLSLFFYYHRKCS